MNTQAFEQQTPGVGPGPMRNPNYPAAKVPSQPGYRDSRLYAPILDENIMDRFFPPLRTGGGGPNASKQQQPPRSLPPITKADIERVLDTACVGPTFDRPSVLVPPGSISRFFESCDPPKLAPRFDPPPDVTEQLVDDDLGQIRRIGRSAPF